MTTELKKKTRRKARKHSLISEHYDGIVEKMKSRRKGVPDYYYELNAEQRELNGMIMESMNHKVNYLKNPRYRNLKKTIQYADAIGSTAQDRICPFRAIPEVILFEDYSIGHVYSKTLTLTNADVVLRRLKYIPPGSDEFSLVNVIYPSDTTGNVAPGNSMKFEILFKANSLADYEDEFTIITEKNNFVIPLIAKREQPNLDLPPSIECNSCWIGKNSESKIEVRNLGGHAAFWLCQEEDDPLIKPADFENPEAFVSGEFVIYPDKFILSKGESITLDIKFLPQSEGVFTSDIILSCDNMKQYHYSLIAEANMIELLVKEIDGTSLTDSEFKSLDMIYFLDNDYMSVMRRVLSIENLTKNIIEYQWKFHNNKGNSFAITPDDGNFENREIKDFEIFYNANDFIASYDKLDLIIKNIPLKSVKNPPPHILSLIQKREQERKRGADIDENENVEFTYFNFDLMGQVRNVEYSVEPSLIYFPFEIPIKVPQTSVFRVINNSNAPGKFKLRMVSKSDERVFCKVKDVVRKVEKITESENAKDDSASLNNQSGLGKRRKRKATNRKIVRRRGKGGKSRVESGTSQKTRTSPRKKAGVVVNVSNGSEKVNGAENKLRESGFNDSSQTTDAQQYIYESLKINDQGFYEIRPLEELEIFVEYSSDFPLKNQKFIFKIDYENAASTSFQVIADFKGPSLRFCQPEVNFGIVQSWKNLEQIIVVENTSDVDAEVLIRRKEHSMLTFDLWNEAVEDDELNNIEYLFNTGKVRITPLYIEIPRGEKMEVRVEFHAEGPESFEDIIEMVPKHGENVMCNILAEIQEPVICLNRSKLEYKTLYANKIYAIKSSMDPNSIVLRNLGNIPSNFEWIEVNNEDVIQSALQPSKGVIEPKSEIQIKFKFKVKLFGQFKFYFKCKIDALEMPIGFELSTHVFGLEIAYELPVDDSGISLAKKKMLKKMKKQQGSVSDVASTNSMALTMRTDSFKALQNRRGKTLTKLDFLNLNINEPHTFKFFIKNLSGIRSSFKLRFDKYDSYFSDQSVFAGASSRNSSFMKSSHSGSFKRSFSKGFSITTDSIKQTKGTSMYKKNLKLLDDNIDKTHVFYSKNGMIATKRKKAKREAEAYLENGQGVALVCKPKEGTIRPNASIEVTVMVFNELAGSFKDTLVSEIKGLEPEKFPVQLFIRGSPLKIKTDQVGLNISEEPYLLDFGGMLFQTKPLEKRLRLDNIGTRALLVNLEIFSVDRLDRQRDEFKITIEDPIPGSGNEAEVKWSPIEPEEDYRYPFEISEYSIVIPPKSNYILNVTYTSEEVKTFNSVIVARPSFVSDGDDSFAFELDPLSVRLKAETFLPKIDMMKEPDLFGEIVYKFEKWSYGRSPEQMQTILLVNRLPAHLFFKATIEGPFTFLGSTSSDQDISVETLKKTMTRNERRLFTETTEGSHRGLQDGTLEDLDLQTNTSVGLLVQFVGFNPSDYQNWPNSKMNFTEGTLKIHFRNGMTQDINLEGRLIRPELYMNITGFEPCGENHTVDFGLVHTSDHKILTVWLVNKSIVPAEWKIMYVPFPEKNYYGAETITILEKENIEKVDNPEVFNFHQTEGFNAGNQSDVNKVPGGNAFDKSGSSWLMMNDEERDQFDKDQTLKPFELRILFKPKLNILYKTKYKVMVNGGKSLEFYLKGRGTYDEKHKKPI